MNTIKFMAYSPRFKKVFAIGHLSWFWACKKDGTFINNGISSAVLEMHEDFTKIKKGAGDATILQFSNNLAKHGKEIYEGDVVSCDNCLPDRDKKYVVKLADGMFYIDRPFYNFDKTPLAWFSEQAHLDHHGSIHENPNLLI